MKKKMRLTANGIALLERIIRSCPPRMSNSGIEAKRILFALSKRGKGVSLDVFIRKLGIVDFSRSVFGHFCDAAKKLGVSEIDERFVAEYFSGEFHFSEIARKVDEGDVKLMNKIDPLYQWRVLVSHTLMPVFLDGQSEIGFSARYENGDICFKIKNLIPYKGDFLAFKKDMLVWAHLSSIIGIADKNLAEIALESQRRNALFVKACQKIAKRGMDAKALCQYSLWAKEACELF